MAMGHDILVSDMLDKGELSRPFDHAPLLSENYFLIPPAPHAETPASEALAAWFEAELTQTV
jgi:LysR family glycine cleavage system transcriptional activator